MVNRADARRAGVRVESVNDVGAARAALIGRAQVKPCRVGGGRPVGSGQGIGFNIAFSLPARSRRSSWWR